MQFKSMHSRMLPLSPQIRSLRSTLQSSVHSPYIGPLPFKLQSGHCTPTFQPHRNPQYPYRLFRPVQASTDAPTLPPHSQAPLNDRSHTTDVVIIGSGIGGLCCAAILAKYGYTVTVCEAHYHAGGAAHGFEVGRFQFDAGPSFFAGLSDENEKSSNPLKQVLDAVGEKVECVSYDRWIVYPPEGGSFKNLCDATEYAETIKRQGGETAHRQWRALEAAMAPLGEGAALFPAAALRTDPGILLTAGRFGPALLKTAFLVKDLTGPFSAIVDRVVTDPWLRKYLDLECFVLSGMLAKDTIAAEMAFMFSERNSGKSSIDYPLGGSRAIIDALVRAIEKNGGQVMLRTPVEKILLEDGRAVGVILKQRADAKTREVVRARRAVVSNASVWDTALNLLPPDYSSEDSSFRSSSLKTPMTNSFMHLHLGIDASGLDPLECHHLFVNDWNNIEAPQNVCIASIPTVFDPTLAPPSSHVIHAYTAGNEPYSVWEEISKTSNYSKSSKYKHLKKTRTEILWKSLEKVIPDVRSRVKVQLEGSPLTHARFLNRHKGSYGPAISAREGAFPGPKTPINGLYRCGDSCAPGIGVPAAAASGLMCANTIAPVWSHLKLLDELKF